MWDVGLGELTVIIVNAVLVFGPDKLPEFGRQAGRLVRQLRNLARNAQTELRNELGPEYSDLRIADLDPRQVIRRHIQEALDEDDSPSGTATKAAQLREGELPPYDAEAT